MARIVGVDLPRNKRGVVSLTYIFGIGSSTASKILAKAGIDENIKVQDWSDENVREIARIITDE
ncbi:MAG: 30S ribosomal protein S13, partial [Phaeodactylibacter sp.]|nr:30S ribosomal protein S13 [Phaeodactylibacter sp.]